MLEWQTLCDEDESEIVKWLTLLFEIQLAKERTSWFMFSSSKRLTISADDSRLLLKCHMYCFMNSLLNLWSEMMRQNVIDLKTHWSLARSSRLFFVNSRLSYVKISLKTWSITWILLSASAINVFIHHWSVM